MTAPDVRSPVDATFTDVVENELLAGEMEAAGVPGVAGPLRVHLRLEFHDEGNGKTRLELRQGPFATGQLGADTRSGWESSFTKLDTLLRASLAPDLGTRGYSWFLLPSKASERFPTASAQIWSYWIRSGSPAVLSTSGTASSRPERWCRSGRPWP